MNLDLLAARLQKLRSQIVSSLHLPHMYDARQRAALRELSAMTDRELHDIGIFRADIGQIVEGTRA